MILTPDGHHDDDHCPGEDCPVCDHDCPGGGCPVCGEPAAESAFWTERAITARAMQQIRADVAAGRIPPTVRTFSQLHRGGSA